MTEDEFRKGWRLYYQVNADKPPRETLLKALEFFGANPSGKRAADLGCGHGADTIELIRRGWHVLACDRNPEALSILRARQDLTHPQLLTTKVESLEETSLKKDQWDLVNASFALPFCHPAHFTHLWDTVTKALLPGGRFSGQFFGPRDEWTRNKQMSFFSEAELREMLRGFAIEFWQEEEKDAPTALGEKKHWHIFHLVACKQTP